MNHFLELDRLMQWRFPARLPEAPQTVNQRSVSQIHSHFLRTTRAVDRRIGDLTWLERYPCEHYKLRAYLRAHALLPGLKLWFSYTDSYKEFLMGCLLLPDEMMTSQAIDPRVRSPLMPRGMCYWIDLFFMGG